jgi:hypothetical protein
MLLPDWLASTWLVASRFCVFVHAFAPAVLRPRETDAIARQWRWLLLALVVGFLGLLIVRLRAFNQELAGFEEIAALIPPGADVQTRVPETDSTSAAFGEVELGQVPAWITAERGGLIANDSAVSGYFQLPVRRKNIPLLQDYPYVIARGNPHRYRNALPTLTRSAQGPAQLLKQSGDWLLYKRQPIENADFSVVRYLQGWGDLRVDREVEGHPLNIAGVPYQHGLGTHAKSLIRIRLKRSAQHFTGACGMDRMAGTRGHGAFRVPDSNGQTLYESGPLGAESPAKAFAVPVSGQTELYLEVDPVETYLNAHADWVNLELN